MPGIDDRNLISYTGMVDRGADISWLSQYEHEKEVLFPPLTGFQVLGMRVEGSTLVIEARLSLNLTSQTLEQGERRLKTSHLELCEIVIDQYGHRGINCEHIKDWREQASQKDAQYFNDPIKFGEATQKILAQFTAAKQEADIMSHFGAAPTLGQPHRRDLGARD